MRVDVVENRGGVGGFVGRPSQHQIKFARKVVVVLFLDVDGDATFNLFVGLEIDVGPTGVVNELVQSGLQAFKDGLVRSRNLIRVDTDVAFNFLCFNGLNGKQADKKYDDSDESCLHFELICKKTQR